MLLLQEVVQLREPEHVDPARPQVVPARAAAARPPVVGVVPGGRATLRGAVRGQVGGVGDDAEEEDAVGLDDVHLDDVAHGAVEEEDLEDGEDGMGLQSLYQLVTMH